MDDKRFEDEEVTYEGRLGWRRTGDKPDIKVIIFRVIFWLFWLTLLFAGPILLYVVGLDRLNAILFG